MINRYIYVEEINKQNKEKDTKKSIINIIEDNPKLLKTISIQNLKRLTKLYDEIIEENDRKINVLKRKMS